MITKEEDAAFREGVITGIYASVVLIFPALLFGWYLLMHISATGRHENSSGMDSRHLRLAADRALGADYRELRR